VKAVARVINKAQREFTRDRLATLRAPEDDIQPSNKTTALALANIVCQAYWIPGEKAAETRNLSAGNPTVYEPDWRLPASGKVCADLG